MDDNGSGPLLPPSTHTAVSRRRWVEILWYSLMNAGNAIGWITFSSISDRVSDFYDVSTNWVNMLSVIFMIAYIPFVFVASWALDKGGLRCGIVIGAFLTALGAWVRVFGQWSFWPVFAGQTLGAIAQPFILNAPPLLAANWFPDSQRTLATTIATVANPIGVGIGFILPPLLITKDADIPFMLLVEAFVITALCLPSIIFFKSEPDVPASVSSGKREAPMPLLSAVIKCFTDLNYIALACTAGLGLGAFNTLATLINQIDVSGHYSNTESGLFGALTIVCGLVGAGVVGAIVDYTHQYKLAILICLILGTGAMVAMIFFIKNLVLLCISVSVLGATMTPVLPISFELGCETVFPVGEATASGILLTAGQIVGIVLIFLLPAMIDHISVMSAQWVLAGCIGGAVPFMFLYYGRLKRREYEAQLKLSNNQDNGDVSVNNW